MITYADLVFGRAASTRAYMAPVDVRAQKHVPWSFATGVDIDDNSTGVSASRHRWRQ